MRGSGEGLRRVGRHIAQVSLVKAGLLPPECLTHSRKPVRLKVANGQYMVGGTREAAIGLQFVNGGSASAQHNPHTEQYSKLPVYFTNVLYIPLLVHLSPDLVLPISLH